MTENRAKLQIVDKDSLKPQGSTDEGLPSLIIFVFSSFPSCIQI